jgi:hypothetical protein
MFSCHRANGDLNWLGFFTIVERSRATLLESMASMDSRLSLWGVEEAEWEVCLWAVCDKRWHRPRLSPHY